MFNSFLYVYQRVLRRTMYLHKASHICHAGAWSRPRVRPCRGIGNCACGWVSPPSWDQLFWNANSQCAIGRWLPVGCATCPASCRQQIGCRLLIHMMLTMTCGNALLMRLWNWLLSKLCWSLSGYPLAFLLTNVFVGLISACDHQGNSRADEAAKQTARQVSLLFGHGDTIAAAKTDAQNASVRRQLYNVMIIQTNREIFTLSPQWFLCYLCCCRWPSMCDNPESTWPSASLNCYLVQATSESLCLASSFWFDHTPHHGTILSRADSGYAWHYSQENFDAIHTYLNGILTVMSGLLLERWLTLSCLWIGMLIVAASLLTQKLAGLNRCPPQQIARQVLLQPCEVFIRCLPRK